MRVIIFENEVYDVSDRERRERASLMLFKRIRTGPPVNDDSGWELYNMAVAGNPKAARRFLDRKNLWVEVTVLEPENI